MSIGVGEAAVIEMKLEKESRKLHEERIYKEYDLKIAELDSQFLQAKDSKERDLIAIKINNLAADKRAAISDYEASNSRVWAGRFAGLRNR